MERIVRKEIRLDPGEVAEILRQRLSLPDNIVMRVQCEGTHTLLELVLAYEERETEPLL